MWNIMHSKSDGGKEYRLVLLEMNNSNRRIFNLHFYSWRIVDDTVTWKPRVLRQFNSEYEVFHLTSTWDFAAAITERDFIRYYQLTDLREIYSVKSTGLVQTQYGLVLIQKENMLTSFHVDFQIQMKGSFVVANEMLYLEAKSPDLVTLKVGFPPEKQWTTNIIVDKIALNLYTDLAPLLGGQAVGWLDKDAVVMKTARLCSYSEFHNITSDQCEACPANTFASTIYNTECYNCSDQ